MIKFSIITVVKNGLPFIKSAIASINNQLGIKKEEIEHIIVCSRSNDGTENYLKQIRNIKLIFDDTSTNKFGSINLGIKNCTGEIIGLLHADDILYDEFTLKNIYENFDGKTDILYGDILFSKKNNLSIINRKWVSSKFEPQKLRRGWMPPHTSIFIKKKILLNFAYETKYPISGDYFFILKLFTRPNLNKKYINKFIVIMRAGGDSTRLSNLIKKNFEDIKILKKFFKFPYVIAILKILRKVNQIKFIKFKLDNDYIKKINITINN